MVDQMVAPKAVRMDGLSDELTAAKMVVWMVALLALMSAVLSVDRMAGTKDFESVDSTAVTMGVPSVELTAERMDVLLADLTVVKMATQWVELMDTPSADLTDC